MASLVGQTLAVVDSREYVLFSIEKFDSHPCKVCKGFDTDCVIATKTDGKIGSCDPYCTACVHTTYGLDLNDPIHELPVAML